MIGLELTSNFAKTVLASPINASATTITLFPGAGALFPNPSGGNYFRILITDIATSNYNEIVLCTARSGDVLTVTRNAEGTLARSWLAGDIIENVMTAGAFSELRSQGLNSNTAIGSLSLDSVTTGANNSTIGTSSLQNITTGSGNSTIGYQSARYIANGSTNLTVATNSTYIGTNTKASANNVTNETVIGYNAIGSGSNTITLGGSTVVNTVISSGNVGIGGVPANGTLDVQSILAGGAFKSGISSRGQIQSTVSSRADNFLSSLSTAAGTYATIIGYQSQQGTHLGTITNQYGFNVDGSLTGATNNYGFLGNIASGTGRYNLYMGGTADNYLAGKLGIGGVPTTAASSLEITKAMTGATTVYGVANYASVQSGVTTGANYFWTQGITQAAAFTLANLRHFYANQGTIGAGSTVTNQFGFVIDASLTGATNNYGFYGNIASGTGRYNIYMGGTAANYLAGDLQLAKTVTAGGTTGAQTINKTTGTINFAAAATSLVVTNSLVTTSSIIIATVGTNDTTMKSVQVVAAAGSFTIYASAAATAETRVNFLITN